MFSNTFISKQHSLARIVNSASSIDLPWKAMLLSAVLTIVLLIYRLKSPIEPAYFECVPFLNMSLVTLSILFHRVYEYVATV